MKKILLTALFTLIGIQTATAQVGIGTETPAASAQLELKSTTKGFLPPRMTETQRDAIPTPSQGLMIYCTNCGTNGEAQLYNGTAWTNMTGGTASAGLYAPDSPAITSVTSGDRQVDVAFTAPAFDGNSTITGYTVTSSPGSMTSTVSQAGSGTITVSGLINGTTYTFTVTATNSVGMSSPSNVSSSVTPDGPLRVGDYRYGGVVFYVPPSPIDLNGDGSPDQGLVCAVEDQSSGDWGEIGTSISGAGGTAIGSGADNTSAILADFYIRAPAAETCEYYSVTLGSTTYNDWFLPSKDELNEMYQNKADIDATARVNGGGDFVDVYWSSTEFDGDNAWVQYFDFGFTFQDSEIKYFPGRVRAVRAF